MNNKKRRAVRLMAIILAALMALGTIIAAVFGGIGLAEEMPGTKYSITMEYLENEQALRTSQRLVYINGSERSLNRVIFYAPANLFRRQSALPYDGDALAEALPAGFLPGGVDLTEVRVNGEAAEWGFQGENEAYLRVACDLEPGESCSFEFDYYLLLTENAAFMGVSDSEWRLSDFYFAPASLDDAGEFILNAPLGFTRYIDTPAADMDLSIVLPEDYMMAATGAESSLEMDGGKREWSIRAENVRDFALAFRKWDDAGKEIAAGSGMELRFLSNMRKMTDEVLFIAAEAVDACYEWFGPLPDYRLDIVQVDCAGGSMSHSGCLWLSEDLLRAGGDELEHAIYRFVARQYFGCVASARPVSDAWLSDSISEYLAYMILEETEGHDAYLKALNENVVPSLQLTIPGGLNVTSDASLLTPEEHQIVIRDRGAAVFHELYVAMGRENLLKGLRLFYEKGLQADVLTEMDLVQALDEATGKSWEKFLTDWVFNIGDYVNQNIDWLE